MSRQSYNNAYLHPYYESSWKNPLNQPTIYSRNVAARQLKFPDVSPLPRSPGLTEVLASYTPGPTVIMIEKKRANYMQNKALRATCITLILLSIGFLFWSKLWSYNEHMENSSMNDTTVFGEGYYCDRNNCSDFSIHSKGNREEHLKYANLIFSVDDDDETLLEDIFPYTVLTS